MEDISRTNNIFKKVFIVLMLTVIPVAIVVRLWMVIVEYWQLIFSVFLIGTGFLFIYFYYKEYAVEEVKSKIKDYINKLKGITNESGTKVFRKEMRVKTRGFLNAGLFFGLTGFYILIRFLKNH